MVPASTLLAAPRSHAGRWYAVGAVVDRRRPFLLGVMIGPAGPTWWRVPLELLDRLPLIDVDSGVSDAEWNIVWQVRMPRVVLGGIVGAMLSLAGASYQGVFRNPLVDPYLLGAAAGAGLGATLVFTVLRSSTQDWPVDPAPAMAFLVALVTVFVTYVVGASFGGSRTGVTLVLAGVAVSSLAAAVQTFLLQRNVEVVREVYNWILGRLSSARWADVRHGAAVRRRRRRSCCSPTAATSTCSASARTRRRRSARRWPGSASSSSSRRRSGTAAVVSVSGLIGFVGIVVPARRAARRRVELPARCCRCR